MRAGVGTALRLLGVRGAVLALLLACAGILVIDAPAFACSCKDADATDHAEAADVVFVGTVVETRLPEPDEQGRVRGLLTYVVDVERIYKSAAVVTDTTQVASPISDAGCGLGELEPGTEFVFYATVRSGEAGFRATSCGGSGPASPTRIAEVEQELGPGRPVVSDAEPPAPVLTPVETTAPRSLGRLVAPGAALALVGLLGLVLVQVTGSRR